MDVAIKIPDSVLEQLQSKWTDLPKAVLEATAAEAYRTQILSAAEVGMLLGHESRWETEDFLKHRSAFLHYTEADLQSDIQAIREARNK